MPSMQNPERADYHPKRTKIKGVAVPKRKGQSATSSRAQYAGTPDRSVASNDKAYSAAISRLQPQAGTELRRNPVARNVDIKARKLGDPDLPAADQGMTQGRVGRGTRSGSQNPGGDHIAQHRPKSGSRVPVNTRVPKNRSTNAPRMDTDEQLLLSPEHERAMARRGEGGQPRESKAGHGYRVAGSASPNLIDQIIKSHLASVGQQAGVQPKAEADIDPSAGQLSQLQDTGGIPAGGMHMPGGIGMPGAGAQGRAAGGQAQLATAGQNPLSPFLAQVLNPRMSTAGGQGAVPTLPGAPQGFSLYNLIRLLSMFKQLYSSLPTSTQGSYGLPTGIPGAGY